MEKTVKICLNTHLETWFSCPAVKLSVCEAVSAVCSVCPGDLLTGPVATVTLSSYTSYFGTC